MSCVKIKMNMRIEKLLKIESPIRVQIPGNAGCVSIHASILFSF